jgi:hypothetical protein
MNSEDLTKLEINESTCSPYVTHGRKFSIDNHYTCFTKSELLSIINAFNKYIINKNLCAKNELNGDTVCIKKLNLITINSHNTIKELWDKIYNTLNPICKYEHCWVDLDFINKIKDKQLVDKLRYFTFKPKFYNGREEWLNTLDINYIMKQYEKTYPSFCYIGTEACDFYNFTNINYPKLFESNTVGIVFNLDKTGERGSHWTSLFIDNTNNTLYYFDSTGRDPNKYIHDFIKLYIKKYSKYSSKYTKEQQQQSELENPQEFIVYVNKNVHQKGNTECGVYSIYFLIKKIKTNDPINTIRITDDQMKLFRKYIFNRLNAKSRSE